MTSRLLGLVVSLAVITVAQPAFAGMLETMKWAVEMTGDQEVPTVTTDASGLALLSFDPATSDIEVSVIATGLSVDDLFDIPGAGPLHLHIKAPGSDNGPIAVTFGSIEDWMQANGGIALMMTGTIVKSSSGAAVMEALLAGETYLNLHTLENMSGEIRGDIPAKDVPEAGAGLLLLLGSASFAFASRARRRQR